MSRDLTMLAWVSAFTIMLWLPYTLGRIGIYGLIPQVLNRIDDEPLPPWALRAKRAHYNAIENLAPFAALVLTANAAGASNETTAAACTVYFWARVVHYLGFTLGVPTVRTIAFTFGWLAMLAIFWQIIT